MTAKKTHQKLHHNPQPIQLEPPDFVIPQAIPVRCIFFAERITLRLPGKPSASGVTSYTAEPSSPGNSSRHTVDWLVTEQMYRCVFHEPNARATTRYWHPHVVGNVEFFEDGETYDTPPNSGLPKPSAE